MCAALFGLIAVCSTMVLSEDGDRRSEDGARRSEDGIWVTDFRGAMVASLEELSGHADQQELIDWMRPLTPGLKKVFLVHGEVSQGAALSIRIRDEFGIEALQPSRGHSFQLQ